MPHKETIGRAAPARATTPKAGMRLGGIVDGRVSFIDSGHEMHLSAVRDAFLAEMLVGLGFGARDAQSSIRALPTYVTSLPTGAETGSFLVADLGGTNLRVGTVELHGGSYTVAQDVMAVPADVSEHPDGDVLFDYVADALLKHAGPGDGTTRPLGFTFSYPVAQSSLRSGTLVAFSKGIRCDSAVGRDVAEMLEQALERRLLRERLSERGSSPCLHGSASENSCKKSKPGELPIRTVALLNDTVGTLLAHRYRAGPSCRAGVILGTGTNAAVVAPRVPKLGGSAGPMVVNLEWGAFGDADDLSGECPVESTALLGAYITGSSGLRYTAADRALDAASTNTGRQRLEKMVSGKYVGEVVRLAVALDAVWRETPFGDVFGASAAHSVDALDVERIEAAGDGELVALVRDLLERMAEDESHPALCTDSLPSFALHLRALCAEVVDRSAGLVGALLAGLSLYFDREDGDGAVVETAVDGSMYAKHKGYGERVDAVLRALHPETRLRLVLCKDDSIVGAAVACATLPA